MIKGTLYIEADQYEGFSNRFKADIHTSAKQRKIRGNNVRFMTKEPRKAMMDMSWYKNKYLKFLPLKNLLNTKKMKSKCHSLYGNANKAMSKFILEMLFQQMKMSGILSRHF